MIGYKDFMLAPAERVIDGMVPADAENTSKITECINSSTPLVLLGFDSEKDTWEFITAGSSASWMMQRVRKIFDSKFNLEWDGVDFLIFGRGVLENC